MNDTFRRFSTIENLEDRVLLAAAPRISSMVADNRGWVVLTANSALLASTVTKSSVLLYTYGADKKFGTADDGLRSASVSYNSTTKQITIKAALTANTQYRVKLLGNKIKGSTGAYLDGEFKGRTTLSGNGVAGGNYDAVCRPTTSSTPVARFTTVSGTMDVRLFANTPYTKANFLSYANKKAWDNTFFHRSVANFVIQGGGFNVSSDNKVGSVAASPAVRNEPVNTNTRGRISMAKLGSDPNSATNQWFFNLGDNSSNLNNQNGGFTAFGQITSTAGLAVMDKIGKLPLVNADPQNPNSPFSSLPVKNLQVVQSSGSVDPKRDLVIVSRVAILMDAVSTASLATTSTRAVVTPRLLTAAAPVAAKPAADSVVDREPASVLA